MKKVFVILSVLIGLNACNSNAKTKENKNMESQNKNNKTLVAYFSASGITKNVANQLKDVLNADLLEIIPEALYTEEDLDWRNKQSRSSIEMQDKNSRPAIKKNLKNLDEYETIYIGFPIWWYTAPTIINTFLESYDFSGKTIVLFATSGGSTIDKALKDLKTTYPNIKFKAAKLLNNPSKDELKSWTENLNK